ncbi:hypothetical protein X801_00059, partial [Opisthorchis viverrini]
IKQSIQSRWSILCTSEIRCSGRVFRESAETADFSVLLYYPSNHNFKYCPDMHNKTTHITLVRVLSEWVSGTEGGNASAKLTAVLFELHLERTNWTVIPFIGSRMYLSLRAEVTHQLEQIMRIQKVHLTLLHFEFSGFVQEDTGAIVALFQLFFDPLKITLREVVEQLQSGLAAIHSIHVAYDRNIPFYTVWTLKMTFEKNQLGQTVPEETQDKQELDSRISIFMHFAVNRCHLWEVVDHMDYKILLNTPSLTNVEYTLKVNRTKLMLELRLSANHFLHCLNGGLNSETNNWRMVTSIRAVSI